MSENEVKVEFRRKSSWQKDDCINGCTRPSTLEAFTERAAVRCCNDPACMKHAADIARIANPQFKK